MIPSNPNPPMSHEDVDRFRENLLRRLRGDYTRREKELYERRKKTYNEYMKANGGKNPIFDF